MISFIVIGKNEGWKLSLCINSILDAVSFNQAINHEIIYVDSNSSDDSLTRVLAFQNVKVIRLDEDANPAIARNVGASESKGELLFFIDGDMEVNKYDFPKLFNQDFNLKYNFISGDFENIYYENKDSKDILFHEMYHKIENITKSYTTGGLFLIKKNIWDAVDGMRNKFKKGEDMDLGLRLSKKGVFLYRLPIKLVKHHTVSYRSKSRLWKDLLDDTHYYARSLLYRKNFFNFSTLKLAMNQDYSFLILVSSLSVSLIFDIWNIMFLYLFVLLSRAILKRKASYIIYFLFRDLKVLFGFFFFYPKRKNISFSKLN